MKSRRMDTYPAPTIVHSYTIITGYRESDFLLWDRHKIQGLSIIQQLMQLHYLSRSPSSQLPPLEHCKGRHSLDVITTGFHTPSDEVWESELAQRKRSIRYSGYKHYVSCPTKLYIGKRMAATMPPATMARTTISTGSMAVEMFRISSSSSSS